MATKYSNTKSNPNGPNDCECIEPVVIDGDKNTCNTPFEKPLIKISAVKIGGDNKGCTFDARGPNFPSARHDLKIDCETGKFGGGNENCTIYLRDAMFTGDQTNGRIRNISWQIFGGNKGCSLVNVGSTYGKETDCKICHVSAGVGGRNSDSKFTLGDVRLVGPSKNSIYTLFMSSVGGNNCLSEFVVGSVDVEKESDSCVYTVTGGTIGGGNTDVSGETVKNWMTTCKPPNTMWQPSMMPPSKSKQVKTK